MVSTILVLGVVASLLALAWSLLRSGHPEIRSFQDWEEGKHEIDIHIFRLLIDPAEQRYLSDSLPRDQFRTFQKMRVRLALRILRLVEENASMSMRLGQLAKLKRDPVLIQNANELIGAAIQLRLSLLTVRPILSLRLSFPSRTMFVSAFEVKYHNFIDLQVRVHQHSRQAQI